MFEKIIKKVEQKDKEMKNRKEEIRKLRNEYRWFNIQRCIRMF